MYIQNGKIAMLESQGMLELPTLEVYDSKDLLGVYKHSVTRFRLEISLYICDSIKEDVIWVPLD